MVIITLLPLYGGIKNKIKSLNLTPYIFPLCTHDLVSRNVPIKTLDAH